MSLPAPNPAPQAPKLPPRQHFPSRLARWFRWQVLLALLPLLLAVVQLDFSRDSIKDFVYQGELVLVAVALGAGALGDVVSQGTSSLGRARWREQLLWSGLMLCLIGAYVFADAQRLTQPGALHHDSLRHIHFRTMAESIAFLVVALFVGGSAQFLCHVESVTAGVSTP